jgi:type VI secretion system protein ImpB
MPTSSQKFIARNRAPRVQIEYDVELYGAQKMIQLPFVMGVLADLSGQPNEELPAVEDRKFLEIDVDNFNSRLRAIRPRAVISIDNTLDDSGGKLSTELFFESLDDFSPGSIARQVPALRELLEARQRLAHLVTFMDGKPGTEKLLTEALQKRDVLDTLAATKKLLDERRAEAAREAEEATRRAAQPAPKTPAA